MSESYKILAQALVPNLATVVYTVPADTQTIIKHIVVANPSAGAVDFSMFMNGSAAINTIYPPFSIAAGGFDENDSVYTMEDGDTLLVLGSTNNDLVITIFGVEIS